MSSLKEQLDNLLLLYHHSGFIGDDPISIPHRFNTKRDIEISGFLSAILSWGKRIIIIKKASELMERLENQPYDFTMNATDHDFKCLDGFVHRTIQPIDIHSLILGLRRIYEVWGGPEMMMSDALRVNNESMAKAISVFRKELFSVPHLNRTHKHFSDPLSNSAAKRFNMYLRWMVRKDDKGIDFGIWNIDASRLIIPLDVHVGRNARAMGLLNRKANDWKAAEEITAALRLFDPLDPVKYDYALFSAQRNPSFFDSNSFYK